MLKIDKSLMQVNSLFKVTFLVNLIAPINNIAFAFSIKLLIDDGISKNFERLYAHLIQSIIVIGSFVIFNYLGKLLMSMYAESQIKRYRLYLMANIINKPYMQFTKINSSDYQHVLLNETKQISDDYIKGFFKIEKNIVLVIYSLLGMFIGNFILATGILLATLIPIILSGIFTKKTERQKQVLVNNEKLYSNKIKEIIAGYLTIKNYQVENIIVKSYEKYLKKYTAIQMNLNRTENITTTISELSGLIVFLVAFGGGMMMTAKGYTTVGSVTAIVQLVNFVVMPINELGLLFSRFNGSMILQKNITKILSMNNEVIETREGSLTKKIQFMHVDFNYPSNDKKVLSDLVVNFEVGKKYAIVGKSGSGKTTIFNLLLKFFNLSAGKIMIDDNNLNELSTKWWYSKFAIVQQNVFIFNDTVKYNITIGRSFVEAEIILAMEKAGLTDFLEKIDYNLDYGCGEEGKNLSGGQKQRIAIARAFLQNKSLILFDEATSALDDRTSADIEDKLLADPNITLIAITHKKMDSLNEKYDSILKLENGKFI
ncbi:ABC transporter ATP-binding protein [Dellaglioa sp. L3N]